MVSLCTPAIVRGPELLSGLLHKGLDFWFWAAPFSFILYDFSFNNRIAVCCNWTVYLVILHICYRKSQNIQRSMDMLRFPVVSCKTCMVICWVDPSSNLWSGTDVLQSTKSFITICLLCYLPQISLILPWFTLDLHYMSISFSSISPFPSHPPFLALSKEQEQKQAKHTGSRRAETHTPYCLPQN